MPEGVKLSGGAKAVYDRAYNMALKSFANNKDKAEEVGLNALRKAGYVKQGDTYVKKTESFSVLTKIQDVKQEEQMVFGWSYVSMNKDAAEVVDHSGESMDISEIEKAAYGFNLQEKRSTGEMHVTSEMGDLVESMVFTKEKYEAMGIDPEGRPQGWWVGFKINDADLWKGIKEGKYGMFSIEGSAVREEVTDDAA